MNSKARAVAAANHGLLTRAQALDAGVSPAHIRQMLASGELVSVRHGVYALGEVWDELDEFSGRPRVADSGGGPDDAPSVGGQPRLVGAPPARLPILNPPEPHVHITRPGFTGAWTKNGVKHHLARFSQDQVVEVDDLRRARPGAHCGGHRARARHPLRRDRVRFGPAPRGHRARPWKRPWPPWNIGRTSFGLEMQWPSLTPARRASWRRWVVCWSPAWAWTTWRPSSR